MDTSLQPGIAKQGQNVKPLLALAFQTHSIDRDTDMVRHSRHKHVRDHRHVERVVPAYLHGRGGPYEEAQRLAHQSSLCGYD